MIACGGTGGHFYPGFALAQGLRDKNVEVLCVIRKNDAFKQLLEESNLPYTEIDILPLPRSLNPVKHFKFIAGLIKSFIVCDKATVDYAPDLIAGMGGYVSFPAVFAAWYNNVPSVVHDSNAVLGLSNRVAQYFCRKVLLGLPLRKEKDPAKYILAGTPVRTEFADEISAREARKFFKLSESKTTVLIFGGSQGAKQLNETVCDIVKSYFKRDDIQFIHITGSRDYEEIKDWYGEIAPNLCLLSYCNQMNKAFRAADIAITRSGASTIAELLVVKKPAIFVPFPKAAANHQYYNAKVLENKGCAKVVTQYGNFSAKLEKAVKALLSDKKELVKMQEAYDKTGLPSPLEAGNKIVNIIMALSQNKDE